MPAARTAAGNGDPQSGNGQACAGLIRPPPSFTFLGDGRSNSSWYHLWAVNFGKQKKNGNQAVITL